MATVPSIGRAELADLPVPAEAAATHDLYERHAAKLYAYCLHRLGSREEAEDAVQTIFMNAFRALRQGVVPESELAWLYKIAENVCLSRHRSTRRRGRVETPSDFEVLGELVPAPSRGAREELFGLEQALAAIPEQQRRAILLREWQGFSYREIAEELELSQSAVETLIFRARRSLARELSEPEPRVGLRRARKAFDLGTLVAALKGLFEGAAAVKATATAVAVTAAAGAAVTAAPPVLDRVTGQQPPAAAAQSGPAHVSGRVVAVRGETAWPIAAHLVRTAVAKPGRGRAATAAAARPDRAASAAIPAVASPVLDRPVAPPVVDEGPAPSQPREEPRGDRPESSGSPVAAERRGSETKRDHEDALRAGERQPERSDRGSTGGDGERPVARSEKKDESKDAKKDDQPKSTERHDDHGKQDRERLEVSETATATSVGPVAVPVEPVATEAAKPAAAPDVELPVTTGDDAEREKKDEKADEKTGRRDGESGGKDAASGAVAG